MTFSLWVSFKLYPKKKEILLIYEKNYEHLIQHEKLSLIQKFKSPYFVRYLFDLKDIGHLINIPTRVRYNLYRISATHFFRNSKFLFSPGIKFEIHHGFWFDTVLKRSSNYCQHRSDGTIFTFVTSDDSLSTLAFGLVLPDVDL